MHGHVDVGLELLDRQVVDADDRPVGKVDDVELEPDERDGLFVTALLVGPQALGPRVGGHLGSWMSGVARWLSGRDGPLRIPINEVADIDVIVKLSMSMQPMPLEAWLRSNFVGRIPGAGYEDG